jgi:hypothetical protein
MGIGQQLFPLPGVRGSSDAAGRAGSNAPSGRRRLFAITQGDQAYFAYDRRFCQRASHNAATVQGMKA